MVERLSELTWILSNRNDDSVEKCLPMYSYVFTGQQAGFVADQKIARGRILLEEKPVLWIRENYQKEIERGAEKKFQRRYQQETAKKLLKFKFIIQQFLGLEREEQEEVLSIPNFYPNSPEEIDLVK